MNEQYFIDLINDATKDFMSTQKGAPARGGWDPVFRKRIESKSQLKRAWMNTIQDIISVATVYGYDLSGRFGKIDDVE